MLFNAKIKLHFWEKMKMFSKQLENCVVSLVLKRDGTNYGSMWKIKEN